MKKFLKDAFERELKIGKEFFSKGDLKKSFYHFERAHILGQKYVIPHTLTHFWMLRVGVKKADRKEIIGQLIRIPSGILGSLIGIIPEGNSGGSNVPLMKKMKIPDDLKIFLRNF